jgi:excisionase family DNA binding protein
MDTRGALIRRSYFFQPEVQSLDARERSIAMLNTTAKRDSLDPMLPPSRIAEVLGISREGAYKLLRSGALKSFQFHDRRGGGVRVRESDLAAFMHRLPEAQYADNFYRRYVVGAVA